MMVVVGAMDPETGWKSGGLHARCGDGRVTPRCKTSLTDGWYWGELELLNLQG